MTSTFKLLAVFVHPDDESMGMGGTLAKYSSERVERGWLGPEDAKIEIMFRRFVILIFLMLVGCQSATSTAPLPSPTSTSFPTETPIPQPTFTESLTHTPTIPPSTIELEDEVLPQGFSLIKFADLYHPIVIPFDTQGRMYVTS